MKRIVEFQTVTATLPETCKQMGTSINSTCTHAYDAHVHMNTHEYTTSTRIHVSYDLSTLDKVNGAGV